MSKPLCTFLLCLKKLKPDLTKDLQKYIVALYLKVKHPKLLKYTKRFFSKRKWSMDHLLFLMYHVIEDPTFDDNYAIQWAAENNHLNIVKSLLQQSLSNPRIDPSTCENYAICMASEHGHSEIVQLLLEDPR